MFSKLIALLLIPILFLSISQPAQARLPVGQAVHLTGTHKWEGPTKCATQSAFVSGTGYIKARICLMNGIYAEYNDYLVGGNEWAQLYTGSWVDAWRLDASSGYWYPIRANKINMTIHEGLGTSNNYAHGRCGWTNKCVLGGEAHQAYFTRSEDVIFQDCKTYHFHGDTTASVVVRGVLLFNNYKVYQPRRGTVVAAEICSP